MRGSNDRLMDDTAPMTLDRMAWNLYIAAAPSVDAAHARVADAVRAGVDFSSASDGWRR
jgi:hypothetical protein